MTTWPIYIIITILLILAELEYFRIAKRFQIVDRPNERGSSKHITLRGGGIIFLIGVWLWEVLSGFRHPWFAAGVSLVGLVGIWDDVKSVPNIIRLAVQFVAMLLLCQEWNLLQGSLWWAVLFVLVVGAGILNAFNFMDGINGMTGGYALAVLLPLMTVNGTFSSPEKELPPFYNASWALGDQNLLPIVTISVLVFCFFNFRKHALCFAGDAGALSIAFVVVFSVGSLILMTGNWSYILFMAVYGVDTVLTIVHRIFLHEKLGVAHRKHAYQIMANELHMPHLLVSGVYMMLQLLISAGLIWLPMNRCLYATLVLTTLCIGYVLFMKRYYPLHVAYLSHLDKS